MDDKSFLDTRATMNHLLDYGLIFNNEKEVPDVVELIAGIPSITLLFEIGKINLELYLNDNGEAGQLTQNTLIKTFTSAKSLVLKNIIDVYNKVVSEGMCPIVFYRYSNLLFYELIFSNYNDRPFRETTAVEKENILKAYLIINGLVNARVAIEENEVSEALDNNRIEEVLLPNFIYQNDYRSNVDFSNQLTRGVRFFEYLDSHSIYGEHMPSYYQSIKAGSATELIYRVCELFLLIKNTDHGHMQLVIGTADDPSLPHNQLFMNLAIDPIGFEYKKSDSFQLFRNKMFVFTPNRKFLLLDISFLIDFLYKTHVFALNEFFKTKQLKNFLSDKATEFMERIYLYEIMDRCFPSGKKYSGKDLVKRNNEELTDFILIDKDQMLMIEFKDTLLSATSKNSGSKEVMFDSLDTKFLKDGGPKGISQLKNAIAYLNNMATTKSEFLFRGIYTVYPVVVYTDNAFGFDGINKIYKEKFRAMLTEDVTSAFYINEVTFINLSFFEINEDYFKLEELNIFKLIEAYHQHTNNSSFTTSPFEVFAIAYREKNAKKLKQMSSFAKEMTDGIIRKFTTDLGISKI